MKTTFKTAAVFFCSVFAIFLSSCGSTPEAPEAVPEFDESQAVSVSVISTKKRDFFSSIDRSVLDLVAKGSPDSLRAAYSQLHKSVESDYSEAEKTLLKMMKSFMTILWPSQNQNWTIPDVGTNLYTGCIDSVNRGIYDLSLGSSAAAGDGGAGNFFAHAMPPLIVVEHSLSAEYYGRAESSLRSALNLYGDSVMANYLLGLVYERQGKNQQAMDCFTAANSLCPSGVKEIQLHLAQVCYNLKNYDMAIAVGEQILLAYPQEAEVYKICAQSAYAINDLEKTESFIVRILLLEPENIDYVLMRAKILMEKQDYIRASSLLDVVQRKRPDARNYYLLRARLQREWNKNNNAAVETMTKALVSWPKDTEILVLAADVASAAGNSIGGRSALDLAQMALSQDPGNSQALNIMVREFHKAGNSQRAYEISSRLVATGDAGKDILYTHIDICIALKRTTEASALAQKLYQQDSSNEENCMYYVKVLAASGDTATAATMINRFLENANPKMKSFLLYERSFLQPTEDLQLADLRSSLTSNPRNRDSLYRLYQIYYRKSDWRRAQYYLKQVVALEPNNGDLMRRNGELDKLLGR
ncbi:MAG: tetratricopeptide repeat protein [Treponema sp.]|nr:tetratricopeptide repeat protein [Treponema sp.]